MSAAWKWFAVTARLRNGWVPGAGQDCEPVKRRSNDKVFRTSAPSRMRNLSGRVYAGSNTHSTYVIGRALCSVQGQHCGDPTCTKFHGVRS